MLVTKIAVSDAMTGRVYTVEPDDPLSLAWEVMRERGVRHVPVLDAEGDLVGLVTHRDLLRASLVEQNDLPRVIERALLERTRVADVMVQNVETVSPDDELPDAARLMLEQKFGCLPVVEGRRLVGILTESDFVRWVAGDPEAE
jgi:CBS domain-containing membrane protein